MSDRKWTPGPWYRAHPNGQNRHFIMADGMNIAVVRYNRKTSGEAKPNANIIAAAPDLYEALEDIFNILFEADGGGSPGSPIEKARAALAKARGE